MRFIHPVLVLSSHLATVVSVPVQTLAFEPDGNLQRQNAAQGVYPFSAIVPGLFDLFVFDAHETPEESGGRATRI
jgi:hypothetical protein